MACASLVGTQSITGYVKRAELIAEFISGSRYQRIRIHAPDDLDVLVEQKDVPVILLRAAPGTGSAAKSYVSNDAGELFLRVMAKDLELAFLLLYGG
jgi:hypothetical protein